MEFEGFDGAIRGLDQLSKNAEALGRRTQVSFPELFTPNFLARYTTFTSIDQMMQESGYKVESQEDFAKIPDGPWDGFIRSRTQFPSWQEMLGRATQEFAARELGLGH